MKTTSKKLKALQTVLPIKEEILGSAIRELGNEILRSTVRVGTLYLNLCTYIREQQVSPKLVSDQLGALGFSKSRISEINTVAMAADDVWNEYAARLIGMRKVLEVQRGNVVNLISDETGDEIQTVKGQIDKFATEGVKPGTDKPVESDTGKLERLMRQILVLAGSLNVTKRSANLNGYVVTVIRTRVKKSKKSSEKTNKRPDWRVTKNLSEMFQAGSVPISDSSSSSE